MKRISSNLNNDFIRYALLVCILFFFTLSTAAAKIINCSEKKADTEVSEYTTDENRISTKEIAKEKALGLQTSDGLALEKTGGITMKIIDAPGETMKNEPFASSYKVMVTDSSGNGVPDFNVTVSWPSSRDNDTVIYGIKKMKTDENGMIEFMPDIPEYSFDDKVSFYPTPFTSAISVIQAVHTSGVAVPYKVKTDFSRKTVLVYVFDFNESGKPETNSQYVLREFINLRIKAGNSPVSIADYLSEPAESLYKATHDIISDPDMFMVCGSVKYMSPVKRNSDGKFACTLIADIFCIDMKDGSVIYKTQQTETAAEDSRYKAVDNCRQAVAEKAVHAVVYGM
jgi:hypothetical protein